MKGIVVRRMAVVGTLVVLAGLARGCAMTAEEVTYSVMVKATPFELRDYPVQVVAETVVDATMEDAGNKAFGRLFGYISGKNRSREKISMTAPVSQEPTAVKIAMTAPVGQERAEGGWTVTFAMPASYTLEALPVPEDPAVKLRLIPARRMAAVGYSGTWSERRYLRYRRDLEAWIEKKGLSALGEPVWARYNPPFTPWFLRRNEILIPVDGEKSPEGGTAGRKSAEQPAGADGGGR